MSGAIVILLAILIIYSVAIKTSLLVQLLLVVAIGTPLAFKEKSDGLMGAIRWMFFIYAIGFLAISDIIYYFVYYDSNVNLNVTQILGWFFKP